MKDKPLKEWSQKVLFWSSVVLLISGVSSMVYLSIWYDPRMPDPMCTTDIYFRALIGIGVLFAGADLMSLIYDFEIVRRDKAMGKEERAELKEAVAYGSKLRERKKKMGKYEPWEEWERKKERKRAKYEPWAE